MFRKNSTPMADTKMRWIRLLPILLIIASLACVVPGFNRGEQPTPGASATPTETPTPTPTPVPLPPDLVESDPPLGAEMPLEGPITLYFNQPMDRGSVEAALSSQMQTQLTFNWVDDSTVIIYMGSPLSAESELALRFDSSVRSTQGLGLFQNINLTYQTAGYLRLTQNLPAVDAVEVDPSSAVAASFNRPVVPLGADSASLPAAFSLQPAAQGRGEWLNTSTYVFYPQPPLASGTVYSVQLNPDLKSIDGGPLQGASTWSFTTSMPRLDSVKPETEIPWPLDPEVRLTFNQPMDAASVEANFSLVGMDGTAVAGKGEWNEDQTIFTFKPDHLLARNSSYFVRLSKAAQAQGGAALGEDLSINVITVPALAISRSEPAQGGSLNADFNSVVLNFSAPLEDRNILDNIRIEPQIPELSYSWDDPQRTALRLFGYFSPSTEYSVIVSPALRDAWGSQLSQEYRLNFATAPAQPNLTIYAPSGLIFLTAQDNALTAQAVNIDQAPLSRGSLSINDLFSLLGPESYELRSRYRSPDEISWTQPLALEANRNQAIELYLSPDQSILSPGLYYLRLNYPQDQGTNPIYGGPFMLVVSNIQMALKMSATDALVWAVDLRSNLPLANAPVSIYQENGYLLTSGQTDADGIFAAKFPAVENAYQTFYAVIGQPGEDRFSLAATSWSDGIGLWEFGLSAQPVAPGLQVYFYTDRPIYRPGQTVYFRAVARQAYNGRYSMPDVNRLPVTIFGADGQPLTSLDLPLSAFGTAHGEYQLPPNAPPGYYSIGSPDLNNPGISFQVASYRKPEINLQVSFEGEQVQAGEILRASIAARYFFDAPAGNLKVSWWLYQDTSPFYLPGYRVGLESNDWMQAFYRPNYSGELGTLVQNGEGQTSPDGMLTLELPTDRTDTRRRFTLEATIQDESGLPVSGRDSIQVNPDEFFIGVRPDQWIGSAGQASGYEILVTDMNQNPAGERRLRAEFQKVIWYREDPPPDQPFLEPKFTPQYTMISSADFATAPDGKARLSFTPPEPGTYQLDIYNPQSVRGLGARTQFLLWVSGPGQASWPNLPNARLRLTTDKATYKPGDNAQVFVPNPFDSQVLALVTIERSTVMRHQVLTIGAGGQILPLPLTSEEAPNVYVSVTLLGRDARGAADFRQGYTNLLVQPVEQTLKVEIIGQSGAAGPGDEVKFEVRVSDAQGKPVQGEFSLAVVDLAALKLADPNSPDIAEAFYSPLPNGVYTGLSLAAYNRRQVFMPLGMGGGGGAEEAAVVRERFPDTAYWNAEVVTGADGKATVALQLPDTLTTWQVDTRGLTADTRVGQARTQIVTRKDLLVRPVTPRFLVVGDHAQVAAVIQNNSRNNLQVEVTLKATGFILDDPPSATRTVTLSPNGRERVEWWGVAEEADSADLVFSARSTDGSYQDAARPALGALPILRFFSPQTFRTSGTLDEAGEVQELVSLPRSYDPQSGQLTVELAPSLAAAMLKSLDVLESYPYESTEQILSSFLPNLETYRNLQTYGIESADLKARLDRSLNDGLLRLQTRQSWVDGGWGWQQGSESDPYITAYVLYGLTRAQLAGVTINQDNFQRAVEYLQTNGAPGEALAPTLETWQLDRMSFIQFALSQVNQADLATLNGLYQRRSELSPWAQATLALAYEKLNTESLEAATLINELQSTAIRSATGAHWEMSQDQAGLLAGQHNFQTTLSNSAMVLFALAQRDPTAPLNAEAVRYLMAHRDAEGAWGATYTTAWTLYALNEVIISTGELGGAYAFSASINNTPLAQGQASGAGQTNPVSAQIPVSRLYAEYPNLLEIQRQAGQGRLYYSAALQVSQPVNQIAPLSKGLSISRAYYPIGNSCQPGACPALQSAAVGERVQVRLTLTLPDDVYYLAVEDAIPAGAEILNTNLRTSQLGEGGGPSTEQIEKPRNPFAQGWGWWLFNDAQIYDERIVWTANYLPAGAYELTYTLVILQPGEFHVLPARAWQLYFPEVQANSAGTSFVIKP